MSSSARKENRFRRQLQTANDERSRRVREWEAAFMPRGHRTAVTQPGVTRHATRAAVRRFMRANAADYENATSLAEAANVALSLPSDALDDETHWVWEEALAALEGQ